MPVLHHFYEILEMGIGMGPPIASFSTGKSRFYYMNHSLTRQPTSVLNKRCICFRNQSTPCKYCGKSRSKLTSFGIPWQTMKYGSYCNLLVSAASSYHTQFASKGRPDHTSAKAPRRDVYAHDLADYWDDDINGTYNLISDIQANIDKQHPKTSTCWEWTFPKLCTLTFIENGAAKTIMEQPALVYSIARCLRNMGFTLVPETVSPYARHHGSSCH